MKKKMIPSQIRFYRQKHVKLFYALFLFSLCFSAVYAQDTDRKNIAKIDAVSMQSLNLQTGENPPITVQDSLLFYDDGGADNKFSPQFKGNICFSPAREGEVIKLIFRKFFIGSKSEFLIYEGGKIQEENLKTTIKGTTSLSPLDIPLPVFSSSADGKLSINFLSEASQYYVEDGWEILVVSTKLKALSVENVEVKAVNETNLFANTDNNLFLRIAISLNGDTNKCTLSELNFSAENTDNKFDIKKAELFFGGRADSIDRQLGEGIFTHTNDDFKIKFSGNLILDKPTTYYLWLAYDLGAAEENAKIVAKLTSYVMDGKSVNIESPLAMGNIKKGISGKFIVGNSENADYADLQTAIDALQTGIDGPVSLELESGQYEGPFTLPEIIGSSSTNTLSIYAQSGNAKDVIIFSNKYIKAKPSTAVLNILGSDHLFLKNLSITSTDPMYPQLVCIKNVSRFIAIANCYFSSPMSNGKDYAKTTNLIYTTADNIMDKNSDFIRLENNILEGGYIGMSIGGTGFVVLPKQKGLQISNNIFSNQGFKSIYVRDHDDVHIFGNTIVNNATDKSGFQAMDLYRVRKNVRLHDNSIQLNTNLAATGIEMRPVTGLEEDRAQVYNNVINFTQTRGTSYAILISDNSSFIDLAHNTIQLFDTLKNKDASGIYFKDSVTSLKILNTIVDNSAGGYVFYAKKATALKQISFEKNALFTANSETFAFAGKALASFESWKENANDINSIVHKAEFYSLTFLALQSANALNIGKPISFATKDILGIQRNETNPTLGAYEFEAPLMDKPVFDTAYPQVVKITTNSIDIKLKVNQSGLLYAMAKLTEEEMPNTADLLSQQASDILKDQEKIITFSNLLPDTNYKIYFMTKNYIDTASAIYVSDTIRTQALLIEPLPLESILEGNFRIARGESTQIAVSVKGGTPPYTYCWKNHRNEILSDNISIAVKLINTNTYSLEIGDAGKQKDTIRFTISVSGDSSFIADFEDLALTPASHWRGDANSENGNTSFYSGSFGFNNNYQTTWDSWNQFAYSNHTESDFDPNESNMHQFRSAPGGGFGKTGNFGVVYDMGPWGTPATIEISNDTNGSFLKGMYVSNNAWLYSAATEGDSYAGEAFKKGDYFAITIYGISTTNDTTILTHYLADFRSEDSLEHYVSNTWEWLDLSSLGKVKKIFFHTKGSRVDDYGELLPAYFCIDNVNTTFGYEKIEDIDIDVKTEKEIELSDVFADFTYPNARLHAQILGADPTHATLTIEDAKLKIKGLTAGTNNVMLKGHRGGQSQFVNFNIRVSDTVVTPPDTNIIHNEALMTQNGFNLYPIPSKDVLYVNTQLKAYVIEIFNLQGSMLLRKQAQSSLTMLDIRTLKAGTYIIRMYSDKMVHSTRFVKIK